MHLHQHNESMQDEEDLGCPRPVPKKRNPKSVSQGKRVTVGDTYATQSASHKTW